jgi:hypothetical protein
MDVQSSTRRPLRRRLMPQFVKSFSEYLKGDAQIIKYVNEKKNMLQQDLTSDVSTNIVSFIRALRGSDNQEARKLSQPPYHQRLCQ